MDKDEAVVVPEGWLSRGEAWVPGRGSRLAVFGGIPGEKVRVRIEDRAGPVARARAIHPIGRPHPYRVEPRCDRWALCGHCSLLHLSAEGQDHMRRDQLVDAFAGKLPAPEPVVRDAELGYAHALTLIAGWSDHRRPRLGVRQRAGNRVVAIPECPLFTPALRELMKVAAHWMIELDVFPWEGGRGSLRGIVARQSRATGRMQVVLVYGRPTNFAAAFAERIAAGVPETTEVWAHWNDEPGALVAVGPEGHAESSLVYGTAGFAEGVDGLRFRLAPLEEWTDHPAMAERIALGVVEALAPVEGDAVLDVDAGPGARTLALARASGWALGIVADEDRARRSREDAAQNGVAAEFVAGTRAEGFEAAQARLAGRRALVAVDIGTRGLADDDVAALRALDPRRIAILSSNPKSLARDAARVAEAGFRIERVVPFDLQPHTPFVESLAVLGSLDDRPPERRAPRRRRV